MRAATAAGSSARDRAARARRPRAALHASMRARRGADACSRSFRPRGMSGVAALLQAAPQQAALAGLKPEVQAATEGVPPELVARNVALLQGLYTGADVAQLLQAAPHALALPLAEWHGFLRGYGLRDDQVLQLLSSSARELGAASVYGAGLVILALKALGPWSDSDVAQRLLPCYPQLLAVSPQQLEATLGALQACGLTRQQAARLVWECPCVAADDEGAAAHLALLARIHASRVGKYTQGGCYST